MTNVIFNRDTLQVVGSGRNALPYELEVLNVDVTGLRKSVSYTELVPKTDASGNALYSLPQADTPVVTPTAKTIETTEDTNVPVMVDDVTYESQLDASGNPMTYQPTALMETTETTDFYGNPTEPAMVTVFDEDTQTSSEVQKVNADGQLLYTGMMPLGAPLEVKVGVVNQVQKTLNGSPLFYKTITEDVTTYEPQAPLEITEDDPRWTSELERATEASIRSRQADFSSEQGVFTYDDVIAHKEASMLSGTLYSNVALYEKLVGVFDASLASNNMDVAIDSVSIPAGGEARTIKLTLPEAASTVHIVFEASADGLTVSAGRTVATIAAVDDYSNVILDQSTTDVYVLFDNPTNQRIDLLSFALFV